VNGIVEVDRRTSGPSARDWHGWRRGRPPENQPPRNPGGSALKPDFVGRAGAEGDDARLLPRRP
jgi:hypothetical protein